MIDAIRIRAAGPGTTIQDDGRPGLLAYGLSASGPMDRSAFAEAAQALETVGSAGLEISASGIEFILEGKAELRIGAAGGRFAATLDGDPLDWPFSTVWKPNQVLRIVPGRAGNFAYLRFSRELAIPPVLGSRATNVRAALGGLDGRALRAGDLLPLGPAAVRPPLQIRPTSLQEPLHVTWGLHADVFEPEVRQAFLESAFAVSGAMDRMGMRLDDPSGVFHDAARLGLVSDLAVPGDIQILGDGTPVVLGRDHQPTGGYPRIATIVPPDLDRLFQLRPGTLVSFESVSLEHAARLVRGRAT
jgi:biotin-dependent carboxylase-like uncharacterized protein